MLLASFMKQNLIVLKFRVAVVALGRHLVMLKQGCSRLLLLLLLLLHARLVEMMIGVNMIASGMHSIGKGTIAAAVAVMLIKMMWCQICQVLWITV